MDFEVVFKVQLRLTVSHSTRNPHVCGCSTLVQFHPALLVDDIPTNDSTLSWNTIRLRALPCRVTLKSVPTIVVLISTRLVIRVGVPCV